MRARTRCRSNVSLILSQIAQRNAVCVVNVVLGFVCVNLRDLRETLGFLLCILIEYSHVNILPQMAQITQRNAAGLHYIAEKDSLVKLRLFCCFGFCLRKSARSAGDIGVSSVRIV